MEDPVMSRLTEVFHEVFDDEDLVLDAGLSADEVDGWDSLAHIRLILSVQKAFNVKFSPIETSRLENVGQLADLIRHKQLVHE
jgi:acyl carrier protein